MIKVNKGKVEIYGKTDIILSELSGVIFALREGNIANDEMIKTAIKTGFMSRDELDDKAKEIMKNISGKDLLECMLDFFGSGGKNDDI